MRTTLRIDDELLKELKAHARRERLPLTELVNRMIRSGLRASLDQTARAKRAYREKTFSMGEFNFPVDKALAYAAALEDEEILEKLARRK
jgi:hypothetical protein